jgi:hypothetical protein
MEGEHLLASLQMRSLERNEIGVIAEWGDESCGVAGVPGLDHPMMDGSDSFLVSIDTM